MTVVFFYFDQPYPRTDSGCRFRFELNTFGAKCRRHVFYTTATTTSVGVLDSFRGETKPGTAYGGVGGLVVDRGGWVEERTVNFRMAVSATGRSRSGVLWGDGGG